MKRREVKGKGEKERYTHLNAEFQRITKRDKKAFSQEGLEHLEHSCTQNSAKKQRKIIELERLEISAKIRDIKGIFHAKMSSIKDGNGRDLREAEDIKKRWQEYTEELYKKDLNDPDNHDGAITHLEPDIQT